MDTTLTLEQLGFPQLDLQSFDLPDDLVVYKKGEGNFYMWNSSNLDAIPKDKSLIASFFVEDRRFKWFMSAAKEATRKLAWFKAAVQPDFSVYYDMPLMDQMWRTWMGKEVAKVWQDNGINVVPNLVLGSAKNYQAAIYGIPKGSYLAVQIQAHDYNPDQDKVDEWTIKQALEDIEPRRLIVYGPEERMRTLNLEESGIITRVKTNIDYLRKFNGKGN